MVSRKGRPRIYHDRPCCDRCKSNERVVAFGKRKNKMRTKQMYYCTECDHKFTPDDGFKNVVYTPEIIMEAVALHVRGLSGKEVSNHMREPSSACKGCYNYIRPHSSLSWRTPAEAAQIDLHIEGNPWIFLVKKFFIPFYPDIFTQEALYSPFTGDFTPYQGGNSAEDLTNN